MYMYEVYNISVCRDIENIPGHLIVCYYECTYLLLEKKYENSCVRSPTLGKTYKQEVGGLGYQIGFIVINGRNSLMKNLTNFRKLSV